MTTLGTIQTVYTTSKKGKHIRLGEWLKRNGEKSEAKKNDHTNSLQVANSLSHAREIDDAKYWGQTRDISDDKLIALLIRVNQATNGVVDPKHRYLSKHCGSYNCAYILESVHQERLCIRVPACGFPARWNQHDAKLLREVALGMKFISTKTDLPIPHFVAYDDSMENELEAPFIVMSFLEGRPVEEVWPQREGEGFAVTEARRMTILRNLAQTMRGLEPTVFPAYGALTFEADDADPVVGETSRLTTDDIFIIDRKFRTVPVRKSLEEYVHAAKSQRFEEDNYPKGTRDGITRGCYKLWELMLECFLAVAKVDALELEFVLMQSDFNPQNILVDEQGNITGLIDWDCLEAIPRQIGWCSFPHWLKSDWATAYSWPPAPGVKQILQPHEFPKYRHAYSHFIQEACPGRNDSRFTRKSHIYAALLQSGEHFLHVKKFVCNVLAGILPRLSDAFDLYLDRIGCTDFVEGEQDWLSMELRSYFTPELCGCEIGGDGGRAGDRG